MPNKRPNKLPKPNKLPNKPGSPGRRAASSGSAVPPIALRRAVANLLRLARTTLDDAGVLLQRGRMRGAGMLTVSAVAHLAQAVAAAERGRWDGPQAVPAGDLDAGNPFGTRLRAMQVAAPPDLRADGTLPASPDRSDTQRALVAATELLGELVALLAVSPQDDEPAGSTALVPPRLEPSLPPEPSPPKLPVARRSAAKPPPARTPGRSAPKSSPEPPPPPPVARPAIHVAPLQAGGSSLAFWTLMDRWGVADLDALELLGHPGGLTRKGTRPRFRLSPAEAAMLARLREIDDGLSMLQRDPREWLRAPIDAEPFSGRAPLDLMQRDREAGTDAVRRFVVRLGMRLSLGGP